MAEILSPLFLPFVRQKYLSARQKTNICLLWGDDKFLDYIRNEDNRKEAHVKPVETFLENKRLKWFGHCLRREPNHICAKSLRLEVSGRRSRGRPKKRWKDNIQGDMKKYRLTEDMAQDRKYWMTQRMAGPAQGDGQERIDGGGGECCHFFSSKFHKWAFR